MAEVTAKIRKRGDNDYVVVQLVDGVETIVNPTDDKGEIIPCKIVDEGKTVALPANDSNRKYFNIAKFEALKDSKGEMALTFKASVKLGERGTALPNRKLVEYLKTIEKDEASGKTGQELYDEYLEIIERARKAKEEAKAKPMTELEKAQAKVKKAEAAYAKLLAEAEGTSDSEVPAGDTIEEGGN